MIDDWAGDAELAGAVNGAFRPAATAAVAVVTPHGGTIATRGCDGESAFEIGSISKALTGMLYRDATERGLVSEKTVLSEVLPVEGHGAVGSVTLSSLAVHRSGLPSLPPGMHPFRRSVTFLVRGENPYGDSLQDMLEQIRDVRLGTPRPRYSNLGFQLLGHAVAGAAGTSYEELLHEVLGRGLATPATLTDLGPADLDGLSRVGRKMQPWVGEALAPAGGIRASITTMRDLLRSILDKTVRGVAALDPVAEIGSRVGIGAGWITLTYKDRVVTWHNGSTGGFSSWMGVDREAGTGVVVLSAVHGSVDRLGFRLLTEFAPKITTQSRAVVDGSAEA